MKIEIYVQDLIGIGLFIFFETVVLVAFIIKNEHFKNK